MNSYYVMHRAGLFRTNGAPNQCKSPDWREFHYQLSMVFPGDAELDKLGQIIDHALVNDTVLRCAPTGSCEQMHKRIAEAVASMLQFAGLDLLYCKCVIVPDPANKIAVLAHVLVKDAVYLALAPLANEPGLVAPTQAAKPWPFNVEA